MEETLFLVGFFKLEEKPEFGFKRLDLHGIFKTEKEALEDMSFCDEAGWYEGVLIEERRYGHQFFKGKRIWLRQLENGNMSEFSEPEWFRDVINLIG